MAVANTAHGVPDELADVASVRLWWQALEPPATGARPDDPDGPAMLRTLRAVIRALALRNNGIESDVDTTALESLTLRPSLGDISLRADRRGDLGHDISAATYVALLRAMARPSWPRLKACRGEDCRWVFVDSSRNTSRRWCDMAGCGNRSKSAAFRVRHRVS